MSVIQPDPPEASRKNTAYFWKNMPTSMDVSVLMAPLQVNLG